MAIALKKVWYISAPPAIDLKLLRPRIGGFEASDVVETLTIFDTLVPKRGMEDLQ